jgi:hypothetical protein
LAECGEAAPDFFCCKLNLGRAENGIEISALPIKSVVEGAFFLKFRVDWLGMPFKGFGKDDDQSAATASAKRGAKITTCFVRAFGVFVGCDACKFSTRRGVHLVNVGAWHQAQCQKVEAEWEAKKFHCWLNVVLGGLFLLYFLFCLFIFLLFFVLYFYFFSWG